jgi:hypothetical protein
MLFHIQAGASRPEAFLSLIALIVIVFIVAAIVSDLQRAPGANADSPPRRRSRRSR